MNRPGRGALCFGGLMLLALGFVFLAPPERAPLSGAFSPAVYALSRHHAPGARAEELLDSTVGQALLQLADEEVDETTRFWLRELLPHEVMFGFEPFLGPQRTPGWVGVSRVGSRHMRHRALLDWVTLKRYERHGEHHGRILWTRQKEGRARITLALASGVLAVCVHDDADAIREVLDRLDGRRPSMLEEIFPDAWHSDEVLLRSHFLGAPEVRLTLGSVSDTEWQLELNSDVDFARDAALHERAARFGGPATLAMLRLPALPGFALYGETHLLLTGAPFQGGLALFGIPSVQVVQAWDPSAGQTEAFQEHFRSVVERESGRRWVSEALPNGSRLRPDDSTLRRFLRGGHVPGSLWTEDTLVYTTSLLATENLLRRLNRVSEVEFELRQVRWRDTSLIFWLDGARLSGELAFLGQIMGAFLQEDGKELPNLPGMLEGLAKLEAAAKVTGEGAVTLRITARP